MIRFQQIRNLLREFQFQNVFRELGWGNPPRILAPEFQVDGARYRFTPIAEQGGLHAFEVTNLTDGMIPTRATQLALERQLTPLFAEHFLIFVNNSRTSSLWLWMWSDGETRKPVDHRFDRIQSGELLLQKLSGLHFDFDDLDDEGKAIIGQVRDRLNANFYAEKVTRRFYEDFRKHKDKFITFIQGIESLDNRQWYASVILNRLMFIYFIQQKRFMNGDAQYLQNKFKHCEENGLNYYRDFLCSLFFKGFALRVGERDAATNQLLGTVPYLNGGLFLEHAHLEADGKLQGISIENAPFKRLLRFFGEWNWHLDERPLKNDREISPDVLGYIFEKYVNQKQMGAYYTKEDITEYISKSTIVPFIFDATARKCPAPFNGEGSVWKLLQLDPDRYIYDAVKKGVELALPDEIKAGIEDVSKRGGWNKPAPGEFALPTEIWREVVARRQRYSEIRAKLAAGEVKDINSLVTLNLNLRKFLEDVINDCRDPELLTAIYYTMAGRVPDPEKQSNQEIQPGMSVLDPTCGSGAFLFAALNILETIYETCLSKMREFLAAANNGGARKFSHYQRILDEVARHQNARYFILKSIIVNNLYGVDIMEEAVEICKLRLFLKLVAQVDADPGKENLGIEPLPDIDFNIRAGNTLVGYATRGEVEESAKDDMLRKKALPRILEDADIVDRAFKRFRQLQTLPSANAQETAQAKHELQRRLSALEDQLNRFLFDDYQPGQASKSGAYEEWLKSHQPFHWFVEFYGILLGGGFDVIIGNPPYVEMSDIAGQYAVRNLKLTETGNLYAVCVERFADLLGAKGQLGVIVPISAVSTPRMLPLMRLMTSKFSPLHLSNFAVRPGKLFVGVDMNLTIAVGRSTMGKSDRTVFSTGYTRWPEEARADVFQLLIYARTVLLEGSSSIPKVGHSCARSILDRMSAHQTLTRLRAGVAASEAVYYHSGGRYFRKCIRDKLSNEYKELYMRKGLGDMAVCLLSSSLYYWFWIAISDCYHVTKRDVDTMPVPESLSSDRSLKQLAGKLLEDLWKHAEKRIRQRADGSQQEEVNFYVAKSKRILDEVDLVLARHFGFSDEEVDFIINYDIKYRLGNDS